MSKASEKRAIELAIEDAARFVPEYCKSTLATMMRQKINGTEWLTFSKIHAGNFSSVKTGSAVMKLCDLGFAVESLIETAYGPRRAWMLTNPGERNLLQAKATGAIQ
jgi:hypothetical protein